MLYGGIQHTRAAYTEADPALGEKQRRSIEEALEVDATVVPAKHFLQEDQAPAVAAAIAGAAGRA